MRALGIDLGTTYTVAATIEKGRARVIPNAEGGHLTPSVVAFAPDGKFLVGQTAKLQAANNPERTIFSIKRRMGSSYKVTVGDVSYVPEFISSLILQKVKVDAENYLGEKVDQAVITVPAYFNDRQRQATKLAGVMADLEVLRIVNEPTAAALAYGIDKEDVHTILVWDLGGGTFDVSILELGEHIFEVRGVSGDAWLGGDDFDSQIVSYLLEECRNLFKVDFPGDSGARQRLRQEAENAKIRLSSCLATTVPLPDIAGAFTEVELSRTRLEHLTAELLRRMETCALQVLSDASISPQEIDRVILVGGASRMPAVRKLVRKIMGKEPYRYINPDEVVACGAAIHAGMLLGLVEKAVLLDVIPLSLGVETQGGLAARIILRNTPLPASGQRLFTTAADNQTSMDIHVVQGERELAGDNISLGRFQLNGIPSAPRGVPRVEVAFQADMDGIVHVSATDLLTEEEVKIKISSSKLLDSEEIRRLTEEAQISAREDREKIEKIKAEIRARNTPY